MTALIRVSPLSNPAWWTGKRFSRTPPGFIGPASPRRYPQGAADACREAILAAREMGLTISTDLNYRAKLWKWGKAAGAVMNDLVSLCDVALGNEEDAEKVFGIQAPHSNVTAGQVDAKNYLEVCQALADLFPSLKTIAITLRGSLSASHNTWSGVLWQGGDYFTAPTYDIQPDR